MNLRELGALLKAERERRGISVRDVMDATKISRRNVNALEEGNVSALPHPVYLKGYIKNYAKLVGLDADALSAVVDSQCDEEFEHYLPQHDVVSEVPTAPSAVAAAAAHAGGEAPAQLEASAPVPPAAPAPSAPAAAAVSEPRPPRSADPFTTPAQHSGGGVRSFVVVILLLAVLAGLLVQYQRMQSSAADEAVAPVQQPAALPAENATNATDELNATLGEEAAPSVPDAMPAMPPQTAPAPAIVPAPATAPGAAKDVAASQAAGKEAAAEKLKNPALAAQTTPAQTLSSVSVGRTPGMQELVITAKPGEACWVEINDGVKKKSFILRNGESHRVEFATTAKVRLGNAGGVSFRLNGVGHSYEGQRGMTDTVEFGAR